MAGAIGNMSAVINTQKEESGESSRDKEVTIDERKSHKPASGTTISSSGEMSTMSMVAGRESEQGYAQQKQQSVDGSILVVGSASSNQSVRKCLWPAAAMGEYLMKDKKLEISPYNIQTSQHQVLVMIKVRQQRLIPIKNRL